MKIDQQFSEPETVKDRKPYRIRIDGDNGQSIEIVETTGGRFTITAVSKMSSTLGIIPVAHNKIVVEVK